MKLKNYMLLKIRYPTSWQSWLSLFTLDELLMSLRRVTSPQECLKASCSLFQALGQWGYSKSSMGWVTSRVWPSLSNRPCSSLIPPLHMFSALLWNITKVFDANTALQYTMQLVTSEPNACNVRMHIHFTCKFCQRRSWWCWLLKLTFHMQE